MPAKFRHTSLSTFRSLLSEKLGDTSNSFRTEIELNGIIEEALLTFGAISQSWKEKISLSLAPDKLFYDIMVDPEVNRNLIAPSMTYQYLLDQINFILIESISESNSISEITSLDEILQFARNRINKFQYETGLVLDRTTIEMPSAQVNKVTIDDEIIDIIRAAYIDLDENFNPSLIFRLNEEDEDSLAANHPSVLLGSSERPLYYTSVFGNLNEISIYPAPINRGELELIYVTGISVVDEITLPMVIPIPNNLVPYIKFGILADIFSKDGIGNDQARASYCESRFVEGVIIGKNYTSILMAYLNGKPIHIDSLISLDNASPDWQNTYAEPVLIATAGYNLIAPNSIGNTETNYNLLMHVVTNAYLPVDGSDYIDVKIEYLGCLLDYCVHLASIKDGSAAIQLTNAAKEIFLQVAVDNNLRLLKRGQNVESIFKKTKRQQDEETTKVVAA